MQDIEAWEHGFFTAEAAEWRLAQDKNTGDHAWFLQEGAPLAAHQGMELEVCCFALFVAGQDVGG